MPHGQSQQAGAAYAPLNDDTLESKPSGWTKVPGALNTIADYFDAFVVGFLQPGWPGLLCTFMWMTMSPMTIPAFIFLGASIACGFMMMGIKAFTDNVDKNADTIKTLSEFSQNLNEEVLEMTKAKSRYLNWMMGEAYRADAASAEAADSYQNMNQHFTRFHDNGEEPACVTQEQVDAMKDNVVKARQHITAAVGQAQALANRSKTQVALYALAASIVLVGVTGMPFFTVLTINAVVFPVPLLVINIVVAASCCWGMYKCGRFIYDKVTEYKQRSADVRKLVELEGVLQSSYDDLHALNIREQSFHQAYHNDHPDMARAEAEVGVDAEFKVFQSSCVPNQLKLAQALAQSTPELSKMADCLFAHDSRKFAKNGLGPVRKPAQRNLINEFDALASDGQAAVRAHN